MANLEDFWTLNHAVSEYAALYAAVATSFVQFPGMPQGHDTAEAFLTHYGNRRINTHGDTGNPGSPEEFQGAEYWLDRELRLRANQLNRAWSNRALQLQSMVQDVFDLQRGETTTFKDYAAPNGTPDTAYVAGMNTTGRVYTEHATPELIEAAEKLTTNYMALYLAEFEDLFLGVLG